ncbi:hypothetical protein [Pseudomonas syringae]|uniref:hypothetical protein n=1 Tax=Pseudomonas syringae TaxID=317 RepID=UPI0002A7BB81|nr:hypothetical protein [Pseudomonas syringae]ELP96355.1 hypothetical protein A979_22712 [Pseudomonas syringae BRIP34876]ELQ02807.1 hypothetical protein A987_11443 [Pseudomonas syringae BRIP34881]
MTLGVQTSLGLPITLYDWELTLTRALLRAEAGDSDAIRSFEITPETLAIHCGLDREHAEAAEAAFKNALRADPHLIWCLQHGRIKKPDNKQPSCFAMLALSLLVDSLLDGVYEDKGQYRAKLAEWLSVDRSFTDLHGIAMMWDQLVAWLDSRIDGGAPFRRLILPVIPASWTHIGYTRYLSFPTKRDIRLLSKQIDRGINASIDPVSLVWQLDPIMRASSTSYGLKVAFEDFKMALRSGAASVDHRFWRLVLRASTQTGHSLPKAGSLVMDFDEDGVRRYRAGKLLEGNAAFNLLGSAIALSRTVDSLNLGPSIRRGILFFRSSGIASWTAAGEPHPGNGPFHVGISNQHIGSVRGVCTEFISSGNWFITAHPISGRIVDDVLTQIGITNAKHTVRTIGLVDGVRIGNSWLGQPRYLPYLGGASGEIVIESVGKGVPVRLAWVNGELQADDPVDGQFSISDTAAHWTRRASFVALAEVHARLGAKAYSLPEQAEWMGVTNRRCDLSHSVVGEWDDTPYANQDMIEALYAASRSGISEGHAISIIDRAVGVLRWQTLRLLQEATFFDGRPLTRWRGRVFTLGQPRLVQIRMNGKSALLVSGAIPARLEADFRSTVISQGGTAFRRLLQESSSLPLFGAFGVAPEILSKALGWPVVDAPFQPDGTSSSRLIETKVIGEGYQVASHWDWSVGRFRSGPGPEESVMLFRLVHPGLRDHDIYRIRTCKCIRSFHSRHAAIVDAYLQAGRSLFKFDQDHLSRLTSEGTLPLEISAAIRVRTLFNAACTSNSWRYEATKQDAAWLAGLLPGLIDGVLDETVIDAATSYRRGRGNRRPIWTDGGLV